jgi:hypothetical protein
MDDKDSPDVASFVIRIVRNQSNELEGFAYHGMVRHVQTDKEIYFTCWDEVEEFIQQVVPLNNTSSHKKE